MQLGGFIFGPPILLEITSLADPIINSFVQGLKNTSTKKLK